MGFKHILKMKEYIYIKNIYINIYIENILKTCTTHMEHILKQCKNTQATYMKVNLYKKEYGHLFII
jgi:hypothetical protein